MYIELQAKLRRRRRIQKNLTLMVVICLIIFGVFMALRPAHAQGIYMGRDGRVHAQVIVGADGTAWPVAPTYCQHGWGPCPVLTYAPPPPLAYAPPPPDAPPVPMGWVYGPYTYMGPDGIVRVSVGADGLNVRTMPNGPVLAALANGVPLLPLQQQGNWVLVAPACPLAPPTYTWSVTAGGVPLSVCM